MAYYEHRASWPSPLAPDVVLERTLALASERGGRVLQRDGTAVRVALGSRFAFRLFGVLMRAGRNRLPMMLSVEATSRPSGGANVAAEIRDDVGWYLFMTSLPEQPYQASFTELTNQLKAVTT